MMINKIIIYIICFIIIFDLLVFMSIYEIINLHNHNSDLKVDCLNRKQIRESMNKLKFCCYEIQRFEDEEPERKINNGLMLDPQTHSKIKFQPGFTNTTAPIHKILEELFEGYKDLEQILPILQRKRVNPQISESLTDRDDLEYYIPQLITYMVIERNLQHKQLNQLIIKACLTDFFFAHCVYFYLQSLTTNPEGEPIEKVRTFIEEQFLPKMDIYSGNSLTGHQIIRSMLDHNNHISQYDFYEDGMINQDNTDLLIADYGTVNYEVPPPDHPKTVDKVKIKVYCQENQGFLETPKFWGDLIQIGSRISAEVPQQRSAILSQLLKKMININLPATVYIPFFSDKIRFYTVLNVWEGRIYSTKQRAPFSIWLQIYREQEEQKQNIIEELEIEQDIGMISTEQNNKKDTFKKLYEKISRPFSIIEGGNTLKIKNFMKSKKKKVSSALKKKIRFQSFYQKSENEEERPLSLSLVYETKSDDMDQRKSSNDLEDMNMNYHEIYDENLSVKSCNYFSQSSDDAIAEYKKKSIYRNLKSWRMIHLMVKIGDDLRQQQFAMQLICRFQYIFQKQKVPCLLKPYEVIALGPDYGLIQMINDVVTLDGLFKKLGAQKKTLRNFFDQQYKKKKNEAKRNFMRSLVGYSLVTYFLQVKDRHNGNILMQKDGSIVHIDFGFFLSNAPGKGVQLQKKVPFKLLTEYVEVLGSLNSEMFFQFRRLFYKGFIAVLRNKGLIISLVKMMYKSHEGMMNCFLKGQKAIQQLQNRMNPEGNLQNFCYNLINDSLDNWRAKWYDKFQYFFQKIYY